MLTLVLDTSGLILMLPADRDWHPASGAIDSALHRLTQSTPVELPAEYLSFLRLSNGGEGPLPVQPLYFQIDAAEDVALRLEQKRDEGFFPGFVIIGSNGGGEYVAFDVRGPAPWPIVALDMTNCDLGESVRLIASSFAAFSDLIGKDGSAG